MSSRAQRLKRFGITPKQWDMMYKLQGGKCPICDRLLYKPGNKAGKRAAAVDHDHGSSKRVRGLTCISCNRFKIAKNNIESAKRLVDYLGSGFDGRTL